MNCRICDYSITEKPLAVKEMMFGTGHSYLYLHCSNCGCLQIAEPEHDSSRLYPSNYYSFNTYKHSGIISSIKKLIIRYSVAKALGHNSLVAFFLADPERSCGAYSLAGRITKSSVILDVGCGDGKLIDALFWCGYKSVTGVDPYLPEDIDNGKYQRLKKNLEDIGGEQQYDIIMMHHSFEHVEHPYETFANIKRLLRQDGLCIIRIPVSDSYAFEKYRENWVQLDAPRHIFLHTNKSINMLAEKCGLKVSSINNDSGLFQFAGSEQYKRGIPIHASNSFFVSPQKKLFYNKKHIFSKDALQLFKKEAERLNNEGLGDQRIYYIQHS